MSGQMTDGDRGLRGSDMRRRVQGSRSAAWIGMVAAACLMAGCGRTEPPAPVDAPEPASPSVPTPPVAAKPADADVEADPLAGMRHIAGVNCSRSPSGIHTCTASGYDLSGADRACAEDDTGFGAVLDAGATLLDRLPAEGAQPVAKLRKGQFLCVQFVADATTGGEGWAYVTAIPPALVKRCEGNASCGDMPFAPEWSSGPPQGACGVGEEGRYTTACPAGWVPRSAIEEFSMGLGGRP